MKKLEFKKYTYGFVINRIIQVIESCDTIIQLKIAERYCRHLVQVFVYGTKFEGCGDDITGSIDQYVQYKLLTAYIEETIEGQEKEIMGEI